MAKHEKEVELSPLKTETVESFLSRGGVINKLSAAVKNSDKTLTVICPGKTGQSAIMSYEEADLIYGDPDKVRKVSTQTKKSKSKRAPINFNALPAELRERELQKMRERLYAQDDKEDEEEFDPDNFQI